MMKIIKKIFKKAPRLIHVAWVSLGVFLTCLIVSSIFAGIRQEYKSITTEKNLEFLTNCLNQPQLEYCVKELATLNSSEDNLDPRLRERIRQAHGSLACLVFLKLSDEKEIKPALLNLLLEWAYRNQYIESKTQFSPILDNKTRFEKALKDNFKHNVEEKVS